jgi:hypothetical protein
MKLKLPDGVYTFLKWLALIALPALATFYGICGQAWDLPHTAEIVTTITAIGGLIGTLIGVSQYNINKEKEQKKEDEQNL